MPPSALLDPARHEQPAARGPYALQAAIASLQAEDPRKPEASAHPARKRRFRIRPQPPFSSIESMLNEPNPRNCCMTLTTRCSRTLSTLPAGPSLTG